MAGGKSTELFAALEDLASSEEYRNGHVNVAIFKPRADAGRKGLYARDIPDEVLGRYECGLVDSLHDISTEALVEKRITHVIFDEAQMLGFLNGAVAPSGLGETLRRWGECGVQAVIMASLDYSGRGDTFPFYDEVVELGLPVVPHTARCDYLGADRKKCQVPAERTLVYSRSRHEPFRQDTLPLLMPENTPGLEDIGFLPACLGHYALGRSGIDFSEHMASLADRTS